VTDDQGKTQRIVTDAPQAIKEATLQPRTLPSCCAVHAEQSAGADEPLKFAVQGVQTNEQDVGSSVQQVKTPEGKARWLTAGEIAMARTIFKDSIDYSKVKVHNGEYLWFGMQPDDTAMTPDGEMYFNKKHFKEDFSLTTKETQHWFIHEMVHVWQHQLGYPVKARGAIRIGLSYEYELASTKKLSDYNMEAQGEVLADFFYMKKFGSWPHWKDDQVNNNAMFYEQYPLSSFLAAPGAVTNLPK
jgi:hypothetical protein